MERETNWLNPLGPSTHAWRTLGFYAMQPVVLGLLVGCHGHMLQDRESGQEQIEMPTVLNYENSWGF